MYVLMNQDVVGNDYEKLINYLCEKCMYFGFVIWDYEAIDDDFKKIINHSVDLNKREFVSSWPSTTIKSSVETRIFLITEYTRDAILLYVNALFAWKSKHLPEDLYFLDEDSDVMFYMTTHEMEVVSSYNLNDCITEYNWEHYSED